MLTSVEGVYHGGKVDLIEKPDELQEDARVIVTFLNAGVVKLRDRGVDHDQAARLRHRLAAFSQDWESPEMDVYDERYGN